MGRKHRRDASMMGSSRYEYNPNGLNKDLADRMKFEEQLAGVWDKIEGDYLALEGRLKSPENAEMMRSIYRVSGYQFTFVHWVDYVEGYLAKRFATPTHQQGE